MSCVLGSVQIDNICVTPLNGVVTTSASTIQTVTYLNLFQLENYKKQFQSFWIPFIEQFIPATTIWVAGERWCNEPCTIINPCDYDFELVDSEVSVEPKPRIKKPRKYEGYLNTVIENLVSRSTSRSQELLTISQAELPTDTPNIVQIEDIGLIIEKPLFRTFDDLNIINNLEQYRRKFTAPIVQVIE